MFEIYQDTAGEWRWRFVKHGQITADSSEGYARRDGAEKAVARFQDLAPGASIVHLDDEDETGEATAAAAQRREGVSALLAKDFDEDFGAWLEGQGFRVARTLRPDEIVRYRTQGDAGELGNVHIAFKAKNGRVRWYGEARLHYDTFKSGEQLRT